MKSPNPYITGQNSATDRYQNLAASVRNWQIAAASFAILAMLSSGASIYLAVRVRVFPVFVEHEAGEIRRSFRAEEQTLTQQQRERVVKSEILTWVKQAREITSDWELQKATWDAVYRKTGASAEKILTAFHTVNKYRELAASRTIITHVDTPLRVSDKSFRVSWQETMRDKKSGDVLSVARWEALLTIEFVPPQTEEDIQNSPIGLVVTEISWEQGANP